MRHATPLPLALLMLLALALSAPPAAHAAKDAKKDDTKKEAPKKDDKKKPSFKNWQDYVDPLHVAASDGDLTKVKQLLGAKNADVNVKVKEGRAEFMGFTPLHFAAMRTHPQVSAYLLSKQADPNIVDAKGKTPLHWAAQYNQKLIVEQLIKAGADVNKRDKAKKTPLGLTIDDKVADVLKKAGGME